MTRGRGYGGSRGSFRGSRGSWGGGGGGGSRSYGSPRGGGRFSSPFTSSPYDRKYSSSSDRYPPRHSDDYRRSSYRPDSYSGRDSARSPERKRPRNEASSSRHESYGGYGSSRYESGYSERRSFSSDRHPPSFPRRSEFRRPSGAPPSSRGSYRGRISSRGGRGLKFRDRPIRRRLLESSYTIRRRIARSSDFGRRARINKLRSAMIVRRKKHIDTDKEDESDNDDKEKTETKEGDVKEGEEEKTTKKEKEEGSGKEEAKSESGDEKPKKKFIKLLCPHCGMRAITFNKYDRHLTSRNHLIAMRRVAMKQKSILQQMRAAQRAAQNELEKSSEDLTSRSSFCPVCKLNYKQKKAVHQATEAHKNMKKFLMPTCKTCNFTFKSPMTYENHLCSIEHMECKQKLQNGSGDSAEEDTLENFTTIDSVGDNDDEEEGAKDEVKVNVGIEHIRKIDAHYCDLCKMYLPRGDEAEMPKLLAKHCKNRIHMQRYIRKKELQDIEKRAEKLQRKEIAEKEGKEKVKDEKGEVAENGEGKESKDDSKAVNDDEEARDDKLWADVDKDLGDILAEAESGNKSSDEDEDDSHVNAERYDRFKYSEKNGDEKLKKAVDGVVENGEDAKVEEVKEDK